LFRSRNAALELIADEHGRVNKTLQMLQLETKKKGLDRIDLTLCLIGAPGRI
jgi:hypothetical protein